MKWLVLLIVSVMLGMLVLTQLNDSATNRANAQAAAERARGEARAMVIEAQAESRLSAAQASAITQAANLPYAVLGVGTVAALVIFIGAMMVIVYLRQSAPVETRTVYIMLPPGQSRREFYKALATYEALPLAPGEQVKALVEVKR